MVHPLLKIHFTLSDIKMLLTSFIIHLVTPVPSPRQLVRGFDTQTTLKT